MTRELLRLTGTVRRAVLLAVSRVESKVKLPPEESPVVRVDQLEHALMDDVRLRREKQIDQHFCLRPDLTTKHYATITPP